MQDPSLIFPVGYGGKPESHPSNRNGPQYSDSSTELKTETEKPDEDAQTQRQLYKDALDALQTPLRQLQRSIKLSRAVLNHAENVEEEGDERSRDFDAATRRQEISHLDDLTHDLRLTEAYLNRNVFCALAESPDKVEDTIKFHKFIRTAGSPTLSLPVLMQMFSDFFKISVHAADGFPAVNPSLKSVAPTAQLLDETLANIQQENDDENSATALQKIADIPTPLSEHDLAFVEATLYDIREQLSGNVQQKRSNMLGLTKVHGLRKAIKLLEHSVSSPHHDDDNDNANRLLLEWRDLEQKLKGRVLAQPDKSKILWGRIISILDASDGRKIALRLTSILDAVTAYAMYSLASGMIPTVVTDRTAEQKTRPISIPVETNAALDFTPCTSILTEVTKGSATDASHRVSDDSKVLIGLLETGAKVYALRGQSVSQWTNKYLIIVKTSSGEERICVVSTKPSNGRFTLGHLSEQLEAAGKQLRALTHGTLAGVFVDQDFREQNSDKPVLVPLPKFSEPELREKSRIHGGNGGEWQEESEAGSVYSANSALFSDRVRCLQERIKHMSASGGKHREGRRVLVISGDKRDANIEFLPI